MRTTALPGPGVGVGIVWTVGGVEVEVRMRAWWVEGRVSWAMMFAWIAVWVGWGGSRMLWCLELLV